MIAQIFIPIAELVIPIGTQTNEANTEIEIQPVTFEAKKASAKHDLNTFLSHYIFHSLRIQ